MVSILSLELVPVRVVLFAEQLELEQLLSVSDDPANCDSNSNSPNSSNSSNAHHVQPSVSMSAIPFQYAPYVKNPLQSSLSLAPVPFPYAPSGWNTNHINTAKSSLNPGALPFQYAPSGCDSSTCTSLQYSLPSAASISHPTMHTSHQSSRPNTAPVNPRMLRTQGRKTPASSKPNSLQQMVLNPVASTNNS